MHSYGGGGKSWESSGRPPTKPQYVPVTLRRMKEEIHRPISSTRHRERVKSWTLPIFTLKLLIIHNAYV